MRPEQTQALRRIFESQDVASLGTLHEGAPFVSMVPFAILPRGAGLVIHVSALSSHTADMLRDPRVSLLVIAASSEGTPSQARARATVQGVAEPQEEDSSPGYADARAAYLSRFPGSADTFELADFSLFTIQPSTVRFVGGFAQAASLTPDGFAAALSGETA